MSATASIDDLLEGLNDGQRRAVTSDTLPLCVHAGAGSGKTRVLTRRIAYRAATDRHDPRRVLALTFTRKAAGELTSRLRQLGLRDTVAAGTFHAIAYAQLRTKWGERGIEPPSLLDRKVGFVARLIPREAVGREKFGGASTLPLDIVSEIEWAKARRIDHESYPVEAKQAGRTPPVELSLVANVFERYEKEKRNRRLVDFDDLLRLHTRDLRADRDYAAAIRWRFQHLFVDEFQDVNPLQFELLSAWLGDRRDLFVVGDPNQAIYSWNGADARYLNFFDERFPGCEVVRLDENYRSSPQVLAVANTVLARSYSARKGKPTTRLVANRPDGDIPDVRSFEDDVSEAAGIARAVREGRAPRTAWSSQAVLVRTNGQVPLIEQALRAAQIPFRTRGSGGLLDQPEVKNAIRHLQQAGQRPGTSFATALADLEERTAESGPDDASGRQRESERDPEGRAANVDALLRLAHDHLAIEPNATVPGFLAWLHDTTRGEQPDANGDAVDVLTFHAAKGLEWPVVHLAGVEQGLIPIGHADTPAELAEEHRLFYVALTRAERELHLTWCETREFNTRTARRFPSPYLDDVELACKALRDGADPSDPIEGLRSPREQLELATPSKAGKKAKGPAATAQLDAAGQALFDALKQWRSEAAKAGAVPAYVVFHDTTLLAIAEARPGSDRELLALPGVGPVKVNRYGEAVLQVVADAGPV